MRTRVAIWFGWLIIAAAIAAPGLLWEVEYFRSPGAVFYRAVLIALPLFVAGCGAYLWIRRKRAWRWEAPAVALACLAAMTFYQPRAALIAGLLLTSCACAGAPLARRLGIGSEIVTAFGLGCAALMPVLFGLGVLHLLTPWLLLAVLLLPVLVFRRDALAVWRAMVRAVQSPADWPGFRGPFAGVALIFLAIAAACAVAVMVTPSVAHDPLSEHLAAARYYAAHQALAPLPSTNYCYFPQGAEMLMAMGYALGGQAAAQIVSPLFWVLLLAMLFLIARECGLERVTALAAVACVAAMPFAHWAGSNSKNDAPMFFFQAAALYAFLRWLRTRELNWIAAGAAFSGAMFVIKFTALFGAVPLALLFGYALVRSRARLRTWALCGALFAAAGLYWPVRSYLLTGNPVAPARAGVSVKVLIHNPGNTVVERVARYAQIAWQVQFAGQVVFESPLSNPCGIVLVVFLPLAFLAARKRDAARRACLFYVTVYLLYWLAVTATLRYALLPIGLAAVLLVGRAEEFAGRAPRAVRASLAAALFGSLLFAVLGMAIIEVNGPMLKLLAKRIDEKEYLRQALTTYRSLEWLNEHARGERILSFQSTSRAYAPDPGRYYVAFIDGRDPLGLLAGYRCSLVVAPSAMEAAQPELFRGMREAYRDPHFAVYRVSRPR